MVMKKALHIHSCGTDFTGVGNSGDYMLGPATRHRFERKILLKPEELEWHSREVKKVFDEEDVEIINSNFDYLIVGGGGLFLPDTCPNMRSGWQWNISVPNLKKIRIPIYVIAVGYNVFYGQNMGMPSKDNSRFEQERLDLFKESVETLIDKSEYFSIRHRGDIRELKEILDERVHEKIKFEFCPTIEFSKLLAKQHNMKRASNSPPVWAFEIKGDRPNRRYLDMKEKDFLEEMYRFFLYAHKLGKDVRVLLHDGLHPFLSFLKSKGLPVKIINNSAVGLSSGNPTQIVENFLNVDVLFCTAGHSQMIGHSLGCKTISLITHNKLKYFLQDIGEYEPNNYVDVNNENVYEKLKEISSNLIKNENQNNS